jgi:DNA polymerase I-like protein with 3'-5' exonuclease and polymerase domains
MADALQKQYCEGGADLHLTLAAAILGITPEEALIRKIAGDEEVNKTRQFAKIPNFGFPGGLGAKTFVSYAAAQGQKLTLERAVELREIWFETWPENKEYFQIVGDMIDRSTGRGTVQQMMSKRIRGDATFTAAANGFFQGRVADGMKEVLWRLSYECYTGRCSTCHAKSRQCPDCEGRGKSVLYGSRQVLFLHDEPILEHPEDGSESVRAERQRVIMVESLSRWMPDIPITSSAVLFRRWEKGAEPLKIDGRLVPVKPQKILDDQGKVVKVKWVHDEGVRKAA